jgi:hypothetical protein
MGILAAIALNTSKHIPAVINITRALTLKTNNGHLGFLRITPIQIACYVDFSRISTRSMRLTNTST